MVFWYSLLTRLEILISKYFEFYKSLSSYLINAPYTHFTQYKRFFLFSQLNEGDFKIHTIKHVEQAGVFSHELLQNCLQESLDVLPIG